ncbi:MAG: hypothetical protein AAB437_02280 [Patescibacteria group bacterium]
MGENNISSNIRIIIALVISFFVSSLIHKFIFVNKLNIAKSFSAENVLLLKEKMINLISKFDFSSDDTPLLNNQFNNQGSTGVTFDKSSEKIYPTTVTPTKAIIYPSRKPNTPTPNKIPTNIPVSSPTKSADSCDMTNDNVDGLRAMLQNPLPPISQSGLNNKNNVAKCLENKEVYKKASCVNKIPWQILAGIHYIEGGCDKRRSLHDGSILPSINVNIAPVSLKCPKGNPKSTAGYIYMEINGKIGCGFETLYDSALSAGFAIRNLSGSPSAMNFSGVVKGLSKYNGSVNRNCGVTKYSNCPPLFYGEDDMYPLNFFDSRHETMYFVFDVAADPARNNTRFLTPGVLTVARLLGGL